MSIVLNMYEVLMLLDIEMPFVAINPNINEVNIRTEFGCPRVDKFPTAAT